jgi:orotate phosphoribosyltransferase
MQSIVYGEIGFNFSNSPPGRVSPPRLTALAIRSEFHYSGGRDIMQLLPSQEDVTGILSKTGALREGHFEYPNGLHSTQYLQVPLAMRYYQQAKTLSVGLSRMLRANTELRAMIPELAIVSPAPGGLPVAFGVCEALRAKQVYWAEDGLDGKPSRFRQFIEPDRGEPVVLVDDIIRSGGRLAALRKLLEAAGAQVVAVATIVYQPYPNVEKFEGLPLYYLARMEAGYDADAASCEACRSGVPLQKVWV